MYSKFRYHKQVSSSFCDIKIVIIISDASIKNNVATSIVHVYSGYNILAKTIHHTINVTSIEADNQMQY